MRLALLFLLLASLSTASAQVELSDQPNAIALGIGTGTVRDAGRTGIALGIEGATTRFGGSFSLTLPSGTSGANPNATTVAAAAHVYVGHGRTARLAGTLGAQLAHTDVGGGVTFVGPAGGLSYRAVQTADFSVLPAIGIAFLIPVSTGPGFGADPGAQYTLAGGVALSANASPNLSLFVAPGAAYASELGGDEGVVSASVSAGAVFGF